MSDRRRIALAWLPALSYMGLIWFLSSMPLDFPVGELPFKDKAVHFIEYGVLGLLTAHAFVRGWPNLATWRALLYAALLTAAWGYTDELHQAFVPGRHSSALDFLADALGGIVGVGAFAMAQRLFE